MRETKNRSLKDSADYGLVCRHVEIRVQKTLTSPIKNEEMTTEKE